MLLYLLYCFLELVYSKSDEKETCSSEFKYYVNII